MFEHKITAESSASGGKGEAEVKMWNVLIGQVWSSFSGFVDYRLPSTSSTAASLLSSRAVLDKGLLSEVGSIMKLQT